eukprot:g6297.t1
MFQKMHCLLTCNHGFASVWNSDPELEKERQEVVLFFKHHKISTQISAHFTNAGYDTLETVATLTTDTLVDIETFNSVKWLPGHKVRLQQVFSDIGERVREFRQRQPPYGYQQSSYMASPMASPQEMQQMQLRQQYAMQMAAQQQALAQLQQQQAALTNMSSTTTSASPLVGTTPTVTTTVSPGIAGGAIGSLPATSSTDPRRENARGPASSKTTTTKMLEEYNACASSLPKGARARFTDAIELFLEDDDFGAAKRLFDQVALESRTSLENYKAWNSVEDISSEMVDSVRMLSVSGAEIRRPEMVKQSFFFTLFWTEALESILNRDSDATGQLLMDYGCNNFVSVEDALQCLQQVTEADLYAVDLVLPLLALHESVASEAADAMSRLAALPENQKTILEKPAIDLLLRASKYHFVSAPLQAHCWRCIRSLCASMPELAIPQVMRGARRSRVDEKEKPADGGGDPVVQTDDSLYLLFHLLSHHSDEPAFLKEGLQTFSALVKHMGQDDWKGREALMKDVLDFGFLFLSDLKEDLNDSTLLRSAAAVLRTILKKLSGTDLDALYTHVLRRLTYVIATYSKRQEGAVPKPEETNFLKVRAQEKAMQGQASGMSPSKSLSMESISKLVTASAFNETTQTQLAATSTTLPSVDLPDLSPMHTMTVMSPTKVEGGDEDAGVGKALFGNSTRRLGALPSNILTSLFESWDRVCSDGATFSPHRRDQGEKKREPSLVHSLMHGAGVGGDAKGKKEEKWLISPDCPDIAFPPPDAPARFAALPPQLLIQFEQETDIVKTICGKVLVQYERVEEIVIYACKVLQNIGTDDTVSGRMMKYSMIQRCLRLTRAHPMHSDCTVDILKVLQVLLQKGENRGLVFLKYGGCEELGFILRRFDQDWKDASARRLLIFVFSFLAELTETDPSTKRRISLGTGRDTGTCLLRVPIEQQDPELRAQVGDFMRRFEGESDNIRPLVT